ncbi:MAG TPA: biotin--[acetyl-CoA-carboxylase] ligase [Acidobacteriaceae bacterium]|nr:biotin--[acetyl-CoA-carboxylase] ligase [Acidobacteriaceae bacterium]
MPPVPFDLAALNAAIAGTEFAGHVHHLATIPSTNSFAMAAAHSGARHGVWIADEQTAGRGRGAHAWHSASGLGLYLSALISPSIPADRAQQLSFLTAIAVQSAIASTFGFAVKNQIDIRWPNDLMIARPAAPDGPRQPQRKVGGILIESSANPAPPTGPAMLRFAVIGIGVNLNHTSFPAELDAIATSIRRELPGPTRPFRREALAAAILIALDEEIRLLIRSWRGTNNRPGRDLTSFSSWLSGKRVHVEARDGAASYTGTTDGLDARGFLRVIADDGGTRTVLSGGLRELSDN